MMDGVSTDYCTVGTSLTLKMTRKSRGTDWNWRQAGKLKVWRRHSKKKTLRLLEASVLVVFVLSRRETGRGRSTSTETSHRGFLPLANHD